MPFGVGTSEGLCSDGVLSAGVGPSVEGGGGVDLSWLSSGRVGGNLDSARGCVRDGSCSMVWRGGDGAVGCCKMDGVAGV